MDRCRSANQRARRGAECDEDEVRLGWMLGATTYRLPLAGSMTGVPSTPRLGWSVRTDRDVRRGRRRPNRCLPEECPARRVERIHDVAFGGHEDHVVPHQRLRMNNTVDRLRPVHSYAAVAKSVHVIRIKSRT